VSDPNRTHEATPKRVREFRKRGDIALSRELVSAAALLGAVVGLLACSGISLATLASFARDTALAADGRDRSWLPAASARAFITCAGPALIGASAVALAAMCVQLGWPPAFKGIKLDLARLSPLTNLRQAFGLAGAARRTATTLLKLAAIGAVVALVLSTGLVPYTLEPQQLGRIAWSAVSRALLVVGGVIVAIGVLDYVLARRRMKLQMRMTPDELKRELKESEGDPMVKSRRRQRAREMAKRRIAVNVPKADVVVVNPTHYAVALRYDERTDRAPVVVAKGVDEVAAKIREIARRHGVPVMSRPPLARALHKHVKEGQPIPANLYRAVAEVLAYVYRLRGGRR
jgi:flagellar biosynthetic protein FlhB